MTNKLMKKHNYKGLPWNIKIKNGSIRASFGYCFCSWEAKITKPSAYNENNYFNAVEQYGVVCTLSCFQKTPYMINDNI